MAATETNAQSPIPGQPIGEEPPSEGASTGRRGRGPSKPFPTMPCKDAAVLAEGILEHGIQGEMGRITLLKKMKLSPTSSRTRNLITSSSRYGLTKGSYTANNLKVTEEGNVLFNSNSSPRAIMEKKFLLAIEKFESFGKLYEKLRSSPLPDKDVIGDHLVQLGISATDRQKAAEVFIANLRYVGLVDDINGKDFVMAIDEVEVIDAETAGGFESDGSPSGTSEAQTGPSETPSLDPTGIASPSVHIDVQIHIDSDATAEQIDQIFSSMAKHLYGRET